jgi:hypothetical protein
MPTNITQSSRKTWREHLSEPRVALYDEKRRLWGFFFPETAAMLAVHSAREWYALARRLLAEQPEPLPLYLLLPYQDDARGVRGKFYLSPWPEGPDVQSPPMSPEEQAELWRRIKEPGKTLSFEEVMDLLDQPDEDLDREIGGT